MDGSSRQTGIIENKLRKAAYFCLFHLEENCQTLRNNKYLLEKTCEISISRNICHLENYGRFWL